MNRGPDPEPPEAKYVEAVEELYAETDDGVPPDAVADEVGITERTARFRLDGLVEHGELEDTWTYNEETNRWIRAFRPVTD